MKALLAAAFSGLLLCAHAGLVQSAGAPDPVFRTGFENFTCPNGILEDGEQCDDNSPGAGDGCSAKCQVESGYACSGTPSACATVCGDQVIAGPESCDQGAGNVDNGDGCDSTCQIEHGYNCQGPPPSNCFATCGDGFIGYPAESCDQGFGNAFGGDGCSASCQLESGFDCTGEPSTCVTVCGDGLIVLPETCDQGFGNVADNDGCSSSCQEESGYMCTGLPSTCVPL